ncbi:acyltransferase [Fibrella sp. HMF5335]|uniref:Acyltransferase n=1 Tax=Fibrella rubiginis TaxID=2817060 RepID=A0A939K377_9BACT|nr:acyltransferase [Fibrella rubiginis]MBO0938947.1 acyltransferase [Fibrella rubiginis]
MRFLLAIAVLAGHSSNNSAFQFMTGQTAVQTFYIISGFYMSLILNEKYVNQPNAYSLFLTNRLLRLFPIYWVVLLGVASFSVAFSYISHSHSRLAFDVYSTVNFTPFTFCYLVITNLFLLGQDAVMFMGINPETGTFFFTSDFWQTKPELHHFLLIPQAWTLALELLFYFVAPLLVRRSTRIIILFIVLSLVIRIFLYNQLSLTKDPWTYRFFPSEIMFFLLGTLAYKSYRQIRHKLLPVYIQIAIFCIVILTTVFYGLLPSGKLTVMPFSYREIVYFSLIFVSLPYLFKISNQYSFDNQIGELSYPIYISHMFVILFVQKAMTPFFNQEWFVALVTIIFSYFLNRFVAAPIEKFRQRRVRQPVAA